MPIQIRQQNKKHEKAKEQKTDKENWVLY